MGKVKQYLGYLYVGCEMGSEGYGGFYNFSICKGKTPTDVIADYFSKIGKTYDPSRIKISDDGNRFWYSDYFCTYFIELPGGDVYLPKPIELIYRREYDDINSTSNYDKTQKLSEAIAPLPLKEESRIKYILKNFLNGAPIYLNKKHADAINVVALCKFNFNSSDLFAIVNMTDKYCIMGVATVISGGLYLSDGILALDTLFSTDTLTDSIKKYNQIERTKELRIKEVYYRNGLVEIYDGTKVRHRAFVTMLDNENTNRRGDE